VAQDLHPGKPRSFELTEGVECARARAILRAVGMGDGDWDKFQIGVASSWNEVTPCNMPLQQLSPRYTGGALAKYARLVGSAAQGAVCD
jgi:dihydroxy-acid dehydratase